MRPDRFPPPVFVLALLVLALLLVLPASSFAQSAIAGVVKDTTGAVLPGVTVEARSPALIEQMRSVTTDDNGQYKIVDLRPGVYSVTFARTGFGAPRRFSMGACSASACK